MAPETMRNDLTTKGYVIIPNFLTEKEIQIFLDDYRYQHDKITDTTNHDVYIADISELAASAIHNKILKTLNDLNFDVDTIIPGGYYTNTQEGIMEWHQDHGSYFTFQQTYNYLNFYIPIEKPNRSLSGLSIIPMDSLESITKENFKFLLNSGARRFFTRNNTTQVNDDENDNIWIIPFNIDNINLSPDLSVGDLIILRGDVIHKSQDNITKRIAISIRATNGSAFINKQKILTGGKMKQQMFQDFGSRLISIFEKLNKEEISAKEILHELSL